LGTALATAERRRSCIPHAQAASLLLAHAPTSVGSDIQYMLNDRQLHPSTMLFNLLVTKGLEQRRCLYTHHRTAYGEGAALTALCVNTGAVCAAHEHAGDYLHSGCGDEHAGSVHLCPVLVNRTLDLARSCARTVA